MKNFVQILIMGGMKIYCEKCHQDITIECNKNIENYRVGRTVCPHCHQEQKRYISEADVLLFFGVSEAAYVLLSFLMDFLFKRWGFSYVTIIIMVLVIIAAYFASKWLSWGIYEKAYFKSEIKNKAFKEDSQAIQRNISWQFMLFFAVTISYLTLQEGKLFFGIAMPVCVALTFLKFFLQVRNEKNS